MLQERAKVLGNSTYKLVFMDCEMPVLDGISVRECDFHRRPECFGE